LAQNFSKTYVRNYLNFYAKKYLQQTNMKKLLLYFLLGLIGYEAVSQTNRIDSLKHQLTLLPMDTTRIPVLVQLVTSLENIAPYQVLPYITQVITLAQKHQLATQEAEALLMKGSLHANLTQADSATKVYLAALNIYDKLKDKRGIARCYVGMGYVYHQFFHKNDQSLEYYFKSVDVFKELSDESQMALVYNDIGLVYLSMNNYKESLSYLNNALSIHTRTKNSRGICQVQHSLGDAFKAQKDYLQAISYYNKSLALAQQLYDYVLMAENYNSLGGVYFLMEQPRQAVPYLMRGLEIAKKIQSKDQLEGFYAKLSSAFESLKDTTKAYKYFKLATKYKDSIHSEGKNRQVEELRTKFNLENEKKEKELEKERRKFEQIIFVAVVALVVMILIMVWVALVKGRRKNRLLKEQNEEIKAQKEEILLQKELVEEQSTQLQLANAEVLKQKDEVEAQSRSLAMANVEISRQKEEVEAKSMSLENANLEIRHQATQLAETLEDVKLMSQLGQELTASLEFETTFKRLYEYISETLQMDCFRVMILNEKQAVLEDSYCIERGTRLKPEVISMDDKSKLSVKCVKEQTEIFIDNFVEEYPEFFPDSCLLPNVNLPLSIIYLPLITKERVIGVISVQSYQTNAYDEFDRNVLRNLAAYTAISLDNARAYQQIMAQNEVIETKNKSITDSLRYAETMQKAMLPNETTFQKLFTQSFVLYLPKDIVSGDFYWCTTYEDKIFTAVVDCTGHGVPGAFMSLIGISLLNEIVKQRKITSPAQILEQLHIGVQVALNQADKTNDDGMDVCLCAIERLSPFDTLVVFAGAHRPLLYKRQDQPQMTVVKGDNKTIGGWFKNKNRDFINHEIILRRGDTVYLLSDGLLDQDNLQKEKFGIERFTTCLESYAFLSLQEQRQELHETLQNFMQNKAQRDDITVVGVTV